MHHSKIKLSTMQILAAGFLGIILIGAVLLWLPVSNTRPISFIDALFSSATSVCVTGLVTVTPATQFTLFGKIVLLILIQVGGLGVIACVTAFFLLIKKRISIKDRIVIKDTYSMDSLSGMVSLIVRILKGTFLVEGIGAFCYALKFVPVYGWAKGIWYSIFHAVSTFCNAGIDILGSSSMQEYVTSPIVNLTAMGLIVVSGLGFPVWQDLWTTGRKEPMKKKFQKLRLHTKLVLIMTALLIFTGSFIFMILEWNNPETIGNLTIMQKIMASFFHSISTRTAGFATISQASLTDGTKFMTCLLMFIGGSPAGTAGGVKTTTIAMLILVCIAVVRGNKDVECFGRRLDMENIRTGLSVVIIAMVALVTGTLLLSVFQSGIPFIDILYETTSALGTVGLSADVTGQLTFAGKIVILVLMYIGRIGPITFALAFGASKTPKDSIRKLPTQGILVG